MPPRSCCYPCRRINIGERYQAEIPALQDHHNSEFDQHGADLVWQPLHDSHLKPSEQQRRQYHSSARDPSVVIVVVVVVTLCWGWNWVSCLHQWRGWWAWPVPVCSEAEGPTRSWFYTVYMNVEATSWWVQLSTCAVCWIFKQEPSVSPIKVFISINPSNIKWLVW